ncbi:MAG: hypothetical protein M3O70_23890 [Actinomycetota bacterium]|nr:hypothetical protein [Actinomycetota bacterium]
MRSRLGSGSHRVSTAHLQAAYPFVSEGGLGGEGVYIGREVLGGAFCYDPWVLYRRAAVTNPNMLVAGQVGRGKSSFVKSYCGGSRSSAATPGSSIPKASTARSPRPAAPDRCASALD